MFMANYQLNSTRFLNFNSKAWSKCLTQTSSTRRSVFFFLRFRSQLKKHCPALELWIFSLRFSVLDTQLQKREKKREVEREREGAESKKWHYNVVQVHIAQRRRAHTASQSISRYCNYIKCEMFVSCHLAAAPLLADATHEYICGSVGVKKKELFYQRIEKLNSKCGLKVDTLFASSKSTGPSKMLHILLANI